jgi:hypothetical protein
MLRWFILYLIFLGFAYVHVISHLVDLKPIFYKRDDKYFEEFPSPCYASMTFLLEFFFILGQIGTT